MYRNRVWVFVAILCLLVVSAGEATAATSKDAVSRREFIRRAATTVGLSSPIAHHLLRGLTHFGKLRHALPLAGLGVLGCGSHYSYEGNRGVVVTVRTDPKALRALIPKPLEPMGDGLVHVDLSSHNLVSPSPLQYERLAVAIPVTFPGAMKDGSAGGPGIHFAKLYVNNTVARGSGSKWGYPKQMADIDLVEGETSIKGAVRKGGKPIGSLEFYMPPAGAPAPPHFDPAMLKHYNIRKRHVGQKKLKELTRTDLEAYVEHKSVSGKATVTGFGLQIEEVVGAVHQVFDWKLPSEPQIAYEYPAE